MPNQKINRYDLLKILALLCMTIDHIGCYFLPEQTWLRIIGRVTMPIFTFLAGYNLDYKFRPKLLAAASIMTIIELAFKAELMPLNILWTILLCRMLLQYLERRQMNAPWLVIACLIWWPLSFYLFEYGSIAMLFMLWGRAQRLAPPNWLYATAALALHGFATTLLITTSIAQSMLLLVLLLLIYYFLQNTSLAPISSKIAPVIRYISRHSLHYYVLHKAIFIIVASAWL